MRTRFGSHIRWFASVATVALSASASAQGVAIVVGFPVGQMPQSAIGGVNSSARESGGFALGLSAEGRGLVGIGANILYAEQDIEAAGAGGSHRTSSLDVPLYLKVTFRGSGVSPFVLVGPEGSVALSCGSACEASQKLSLQAVVGAGVMVGAAHRVSVQVRYVSGFTNQDTGFGANPGGFAEPPTSFKMRSLRLFASIGL